MIARVEGVTCAFGKLRALDDVNLAFRQGEIVALLGANAAGKTTLLRCMAGILAPNAGRVTLDGEELRPARLDLRRRFFFMPDFPVLFPSMTLVRHIGMVLRLYEADRDGVENRVTELLSKFDLLSHAELPLISLSRGQLYKGAILALIAADPELWLVDEPFASGVDALGIASLKEELRNASARGRTVIYSTQILDIAERFSDRACIIHQGRIRAFDSVNALGGSVAAKDGVLEALLRGLRNQS